MFVTCVESVDGIYLASVREVGPGLFRASLLEDPSMTMHGRSAEEAVAKLRRAFVPCQDRVAC